MLDIDDHLVLRSWTTGDATALAAAFSDPDIQQWNLHSFTLAEAEHWIAEMALAWEAETSAGWAVARRSDGAVLGRVSLREIRLDAGMAEVTYWVVPEARGQGVAPRAVGAVSRWALDDLGLHRLELFHSVHNSSSCRVAEKAGFDYEGTLRSALLHADGWHDMHLHARLPDAPTASPGVRAGD